MSSKEVFATKERERSLFVWTQLPRPPEGPPALPRVVQPFWMELIEKQNQRKDSNSNSNSASVAVVDVTTTGLAAAPSSSRM